MYTYYKAKLTYTINGVDYDYADIYRFDNNHYDVDSDQATEYIYNDLLEYLECNRNKNKVSDYNITIDTTSKEHYHELTIKLDEMTGLRIKMAHLNREIEELRRR